MKRVMLLLVCFSLTTPFVAAADQSSAETPVSYWKQIAPILQKNCAACHRENQAEGGLSMETPKIMIDGGDGGEGIVAGEPDSSLVYARASGIEEPLMPPEDNSVGAKPLSPTELNLLKRWILEGAVVDKQGADPAEVWQPIDPSIRSVFSMANSPDNRVAAIAHANRVEMVDAVSGEVVGRLVDPTLPQEGTTARDMVGAIAFSPQGDRLATGGFKSVRIWKRAKQSPRPLPTASPAMMASSPRGDVIASVNALNDIELRRQTDGEVVHRFQSPSRVTALQWLGDRRLCAAYSTGEVRLLDPAEGASVKQWTLEQPVVAMEADADKRFTAMLRADSKLDLLDGDAWTERAVLDAISDARTLCFRSPGELLIGTASGVVQLVDVVADRIVRDFQHGSSVEALTVTSDGTRVISGGADGVIKVWQVSDGQMLFELTGDREIELQLASVNRDIKLEEGALTHLRGQTESLNKRLESEEAALKEVVAARDKAKQEAEEKQRATADAAQQIEMTKQAVATARQMIEKAEKRATETEMTIVESEKRLATWKSELTPMEKQASEANESLQAAEQKLAEMMKAVAEKREQATALQNRVRDKQAMLAAEEAAMTNAKKQLEAIKQSAQQGKATVEQETKKLEAQQKDLEKLTKEKEQKQAELAKREQAFVTAKKTRDLAAARIPQHENQIRQRGSRLADHQRRLHHVNRLRSESTSVISFALGPKQTRLAALHRNGRVVLFDLTTGQPLDSFRVAIDPQLETKITFDEANRVVIRQPTRRPWEIELAVQWQLAERLGGLSSDLISDRVTSLDFSPDGTSLAIGSGLPSRRGQVLVVSAHDGAVLRRFEDLHSDNVQCVQFSPDGTKLASSSADKSIRVTDLRNGEVTAALDGHTHHVLSIAWRHDGRQLVSGSADKSIKVWDVISGQQTRTVGGFPDEVTAVAFLGQTSEVVSACADGQVRIHDANNGQYRRGAGVGGDYLFALGITPNRQKILAAGFQGQVHVWNAADMKEAATWK
jgi:WD40 repeat protein